MSSNKVALAKPLSSPTLDVVDAVRHFEKPRLPETPCDNCVEASRSSSDDEEDEEDEDED